MKFISFAICLMSLILALAIFQLPNAEAQEADMALDGPTLSFDPAIGAFGQETIISVGITNNGYATAENVRVDFYIKNADDSDTFIGSWQGGIVSPSETVIASYAWTPTNKGVYSIWANVMAAGEDQANLTDNNNLAALKNYQVDEPAWIMWAIMACTFMVIVSVFLGTRYFMKASPPTRYPITEEDLWDGDFSEEVLDESVGIYIPEKIKLKKETEIFVYFENCTKKPIEDVSIDFSGLDRDFRRDRDINKERIESGESIEKSLKISPRSGKGIYKFRIPVSGGGLTVEKEFEVRVG